MPHYDLRGRVVAITGATGGLASALAAAALRAKGAHLALFDLDLAKVEAQAKTLGALTVARGWTANVRSMDSLEAAMAEAAAHFGHTDVLIANAGIDTMAPMATVSAESESRHLAYNVNLLSGTAGSDATAGSGLRPSSSSLRAAMWSSGALTDSTQASRPPA